MKIFRARFQCGYVATWSDYNQEYDQTPNILVLLVTASTEERAKIAVEVAYQGAKNFIVTEAGEA